MTKRSERIEALICECRISDECVDAACVAWKVVNDRDPRYYESALVEFGAFHAGSDVTYAVANGVLRFFLGTEAEALDRLLAAEVMGS